MTNKNKRERHRNMSFLYFKKVFYIRKSVSISNLKYYVNYDIIKLMLKSLGMSFYASVVISKQKIKNLEGSFMTSDQLFMYLAPRCLIATLLIIVAIAILCFLGHVKAKNLKSYWYDVRMAIIGIGTFVFFILFLIVFFLPNSSISDFLPTIKHRKEIVLPAEEIEVVNIIEQEHVINIPSIVLPLQPEGEQAIVIDISSELKSFINGFYEENVEFFNQRQKATYLFSSEGFKNFTGLELNSIQYEETETSTYTINLDQLGYETIWLFTDLSTELEPTTCKVILYVPRSITEQEMENLKKVGDVTIITIEER